MKYLTFRSPITRYKGNNVGPLVVDTKKCVDDDDGDDGQGMQEADS